MTHLRRPEFVCLTAALILAILAGGQPLMDALPGGGMVAALSGQPEAARLLRFIIGLLVLGGLAYVILTNRAVVTPKLPIQAALGGIVATMGVGIIASSFPMASLDAWLHWTVFVGAFLLGVCSVGRKEGPLIALLVIAGAAGIVGLRGVMEYAEMRSIEPSYRIFAGWSNPNAVATLFVAAMPICIVCAAVTEKIPRIVSIVSLLLVTCGLLLTQSKGGFLAAGVCLVVTLALYFAWKGAAKNAAAPAVGLILGILLFGLLQFGPRPGGAGGQGPGLGRITGAAAESEQSGGFRTLLWKTSIELAKEKPMGWGPGVFRFVSGRPGLVTQTVTAHQTWLQILVEGGVLALASVLALAALWLARVFAGWKQMTEEQNVLRAGIVGSVVGIGAHAFVESNLTYLGIGILLFALMGIGLQLCADGSSPELTPKPLRQLAAMMGCAIPLLLLVISARSEAAKGALVEAAGLSSPNLKALADEVKGSSFGDGEGHYLYGLYGSSTPDERAAELTEAVKTYPSTKALRQLARANSAIGKNNEAIASLVQALKLDPNNLPAAFLKMETLEKAGDDEMAITAAKELIAKESTSAFNVRSLAESVPTETYRARLWLAKKTQDPAEKKELIAGAVNGFSEFSRLTVPQMVRFQKGGSTYTGLRPDEVKEWLTDVLDQGKSLEDPGLKDDLEAVTNGLAALEEASSS